MTALYWTANNSSVLIGRSIRHIFRNPDQAMTAIFLPVAIMLMFRYVFGGAIDVGGTAYIDYVLAGIIAISVTFNSTSTTVGVADDLERGVVERFRTMPMSSTAVLTGHVVGALARNVVSLAIMIGVGLLIGFSPAAGVGGWLAALGILLVFTLAVSWVAAILGLLAGSVESAAGLGMVLVFVPYLSSAFVPPSTMPGGLRAFVENQPVTPVVDSVRNLLLGAPVGDSAWLALVWWGGITLVAVPVAGALFRRRARR
ncbi:ABC transporter permease [Amycolatopsis thermalba]|uniref:Transport permease protein n=1 Tax=Amycolatopsis thermalba TaxID=944492 RepID=A0ABY4NTR3_9PSEU|nr:MULTISPECIES: ABC transporter permease [Amycolatopsis]OXM66111.1 multidrug ABC transporter permease [Amycolatopsis sp. KNN50.9b]UQS23435.1 ABC transporter permease [Amycolatopsis thermalba]